MPKRGDKELLLDMIEAIKRIEQYTNKLSYRDFLKKIETQDAVVRNFEIIGEAVKNVSKTLKAKYNHIQWKEIAGMRDKVIHFYFGVHSVRKGRVLTPPSLSAGPGPDRGRGRQECWGFLTG